MDLHIFQNNGVVTRYSDSIPAASSTVHPLKVLLHFTGQKNKTQHTKSKDPP